MRLSDKSKNILKNRPTLLAGYELAKQISGIPLPEDYKATGKYAFDIAGIRHAYTNYDDTLYKLPFEYCRDCPFLSLGEETCPPEEETHDILKEAARSEAASLYDQWWRRYHSPEAKGEGY